MTTLYIAILDYSCGIVFTTEVTTMHGTTEEIEAQLAQQGFKVSNISYMCTAEKTRVININL